MVSKDNFLVSIREVELLNNDVDEKKKDFPTYFKAIVLFLCTKLEKYVADSAKEFILEIKNKGIKSKSMPSGLKEMVVQNELEKINKNGLQRYSSNENFKKGATNFSLIWDDDFTISYLDENEFYIELSSHGTTIINDLYKKIGYFDLVNRIPDYTVVQTVAGVSSTVSHNVCNVLNRIVGMRNNIIHQDATPAITKQDINLFIYISKYFVEWISNFLDSELVQY